MYQLWKYFVYTPKDTKFTRFLSKFITPKNIHNYDLAYTNINQFDFSKTSKIKKLDFDNLRLRLSELYTMYMSKKTDSELLEKAKEYNLVNILITIDEVHNFLGTKVDDVLKWWLTYHGHLHQDLFFITQDLSLVHTQYKSNAEYFYKAIPPSARLSTKKFRYTQYRNSRMAMNGKIRDFTIPALQEIYNMYVSGAENNSKSVVKKFLYIGGFMSIFLIIGIYMFISSFKENVSSDNNITNVQNESINSNNSGIISANNRGTEQKTKEVKKEVKKEKKLFEINCFNKICSYEKKDFPKILLMKIINDNKDSFAYKVENPSFTKYFVLIQKETFNFLQSEVKKNAKNKSIKKGTNTTFSLL